MLRGPRDGAISRVCPTNGLPLFVLCSFVCVVDLVVLVGLRVMDVLLLCVLVCLLG